MGAEARRGQVAGGWAMGQCTMAVVVVGINLHLVLYQRTWYWYTVAVACAEALLFAATVPLMNALWVGDLTGVAAAITGHVPAHPIYGDRHGLD